MKKRKIVILTIIALICIGLNIPQFFQDSFDKWSLFGGFGLEFGAALILFLIFDVRDKKYEEKRLLEENERKNKFIKKLINSCIFEDWAIDFLKNDKGFVSLNDFGMLVNRGYIDDNITQSLKELYHAC